MKLMICSSSRDEIDKEYKILADAISKELNNKGHDLIFGAATTGMMGMCQNNFKHIYTYTVQKYIEDLRNINSSEEYILNTTFDRTKEMYLDCDAVIALPGGTGTMTEILSIIEENRSIDNPKPLIIYNYKGFYNTLFNLIDILIETKFNDSSIKDNYQVCDNINDLLNILKSTN